MDMNAKIFLKSIDHTNPKRRIIAFKVSALKTESQIQRSANIE
jgi:hypothetical protein